MSTVRSVSSILLNREKSALVPSGDMSLRNPFSIRPPEIVSAESRQRNSKRAETRSIIFYPEPPGSLVPANSPMRPTGLLPITRLPWTWLFSPMALCLARSSLGSRTRYWACSSASIPPIPQVEEPSNRSERSNRKQRVYETASFAPLVHRPTFCGILEAEREAYLSAMVDYRRPNEVSVQLERSLDLPKSYELVDVSELVGEKRSDRWTFAGKNGAYGVYELSAAGFSSDMTLAIVYVGYDCPWCSRWALHILKKTDGNWKQVATGCDVIS